jgi:dihydroorotate dehydrogenase (fumarate)
MVSLGSRYLSLPLAHPFILGASPLTWHPDNAKRLEDGGCAAIVMHSLFEEAVRTEDIDWSRAGSRTPDAGGPGALLHFARSDRTWFGPDEYLEQVRAIRASVAIPVIASLNGVSPVQWVALAPQLVDAGADAIEVNTYGVTTGLRTSAAQVEDDLVAFVRGLAPRMGVPLAVKLSPFYTAFAHLASRLDEAGAAGLVLFNRFYEADIDIESLTMEPNARLSTSSELALRLHWTALLSGRVNASLAVCGGAMQAIDGVKAIVCGAHTPCRWSPPSSSRDRGSSC